MRRTLYECVVFFKHFCDDRLAVCAELFLSLLIEIIWIDGFPVFQDDMRSLDPWKMVLKNICRVCDRHRDDRSEERRVGKEC